MAVEPGTHNSFGLNCTDSKGNTIEILTTDLINILVDNTTYSGTISYTSGVFYLDGITDENTAHTATITINKEGYSQYTFTVSLGVDGFAATVNVTLTAPLTLSDRLQIISDSKKAIKAAIEAKGVTDVGDKIADYAGKIESIESGGLEDSYMWFILAIRDLGNYMTTPISVYSSSDKTNWEYCASINTITEYLSSQCIIKVPMNTKYLKLAFYGTPNVTVSDFYMQTSNSTVSGILTKQLTHSSTKTTDNNVEHIITLLDTYNTPSSFNNIFVLIYENQCLIKGTLITLSDGSKKPIEDITFDDDILVWNFYEGKFDTAKPLFIKSPQIASKYNLCTFSDGTKIGFVGEGGEKGYHRIFNADKGSFTYTGNDKDTPIGTCTFNENSSFPELVSQEIIEEPVEYYNVITDKHYNLFTNGILTSMHWSNQYDIDTDKMVYMIDNQNITDETISEEMNEMKENNILWKTL